MTNRMVGFGLSLMTLMTFLFGVEAGVAQTYTQMQWGMNKTVNPYNFGANINGTWRNLGTVSPAGQWSIDVGNISGFGTAASKNIGTSGATVPLLNAANTWSGAQTFTSPTTINTGTMTGANNSPSLELMSHQSINYGTYVNHFAQLITSYQDNGAWNDNWGFASYSVCSDTLQNYSCVGGLHQAQPHPPTTAKTSTVTITISAPAVMTHNMTLVTGDMIKFTTTGALPSGLTAGTAYFCIRVNATQCQLATSIKNAFAGTAITTTGSQSGVQTATLQTGVGNYTGGNTVSYGGTGFDGLGVYVGFESDVDGPRSPSSIVNGVRVGAQSFDSATINHGQYEDTGVMIAATNGCGNKGSIGCGFEVGIELGENFFNHVYGDYPSTWPILPNGTYFRAYPPTGLTFNAAFDLQAGAPAFNYSAIVLPPNSTHNGIAWGGGREGGEIYSTAITTGGKLQFNDSFFEVEKSDSTALLTVDNSGNATSSGSLISSYSVVVGSNLIVTPTVVANLGTCGSGEKGYIRAVTDGAASLAWGATVTGGGSAYYTVNCNGTNWTVMGK